MQHPYLEFQFEALSFLSIITSKNSDLNLNLIPIIIDKINSEYVEIQEQALMIVNNEIYRYSTDEILLNDIIKYEIIQKLINLLINCKNNCFYELILNSIGKIFLSKIYGERCIISILDSKEKLNVDFILF